MRARSRFRVAVLTATATLPALAVTLGAHVPANATVGQTLYVASGGTGSCTSTAPCGTFDAAVGKVTGEGAVVLVAGGTYAGQSIAIHSITNALASNVVIKPAVGARVTVAGVNILTPHVTVQNLTSTGTIYLKPGAHYSGFDAITTVGASGYISSANYAFIRNSKIHPAIDNDAVQIKTWGAPDPVGVILENNVLGPTTRGPSRAHVDCLQILGGSNLRIRYNVLYQCASQGIIAGDGATGIVGSGSVIERNFIQLCPVRTTSCDGYDAVNLAMPGLVFSQNTVIDGSAKIVGASVILGNYFDSLQTCSGSVMSNLWGKSNHCSIATVAKGNTKGIPSFVSRTAAPPDLHLRAGSIGTSMGFTWTGIMSSTDIDGQLFARVSADRGADQATLLEAPAQPSPSPSATVTPTTAPTVAPLPTATPTLTATPTTTTTPTTPTPTPTPTVSPTVSPAPAPTATLSTTVTTYTGNTNSVAKTDQYKATSRGGPLSASAKVVIRDGVSKALTVVTLSTLDGRVLSTVSGGAAVTVSATVAAGTYLVRITSVPSTYSLAVTST